ncbi:Cc-nbs-lrr resistance protein, putative [Theobroma cacao]|uniref:Cc-nbs-lrr resistance protein, putative n=1 Tax=Theobroma cacao TaxID=3641 RepID=A0A061G8B9_THECC|nr:Cc-nbs-lrr resistance protein, putative [Theobroma cacao]
MGNLCSISISMEDTVSRCWDCIVRQASYMCKLEENHKALSLSLEELRAQRDDVNRRVDCAELQLLKRLSQVQVWLSRAETMITEVEELIKDIPQETQKLCHACCFSKNFKSSYKLGQQVARKLEEMDDLKKKGVFDKVAENQPVAPMDVRPIESTVGLESTLLEVWSLLQEKDVGIIGLYGLGGVCKTSLLAQINNKFCSMPVGYDIVIWLVVSKDHTVSKIQEKIAEKIGLSNDMWKMKSCDGKARDIFTVLNKKKFVLFLDDLWERVDLIKVGIPLPSLENGSKLVFTTRHLEVCGKMEAQKKIKVECLGADESWKLFQDKVGEETLDSHPDIRKLAKMVAAECGGLPLALITIGRAMACKKIPEAWEYAIEVLKQSAHRFAGMEEEVFSLLIFSYDSLPSDTMRSCLLYFSLYPEDHVINKRNLIEYWFCEGLLDEFDSMRKALLQGYNIIDSLLNACLLEQAGEDYVRMHDVIRDMCLWIACEREAVEKRFFVQVGHQLGEAPDVGKWEGVRRMSLMRNQIVNLRSTPTCPNLRTLFLNKNTLKVISEGFFKLMPNLRVLNLSDNTDLRELPEGISELVSLEYLNLSGTGIEELPVKLKSLTKFKCLDLSSTENLKRIPQQLISSFSILQVYRMVGSGVYYQDGMIEGNVLNGGNAGLIEELKCLQHLNMLSIEIKSAFALETFLTSRNLQGCAEELVLRNFPESKVLDVLSLANMERLEFLHVANCDNMEEMKITRDFGEMRMAQTNTPFNSLGRVFIERCRRLRDVTWLTFAPNLTMLSVHCCPKMEEIMSERKLNETENVVGIPYPNRFAKLKELHLRHLPQLKSICSDALPFPCLTDISVFKCSKLKKLPLSFDPERNKISIQGTLSWWKELEWEDETARNKCLFVDSSLGLW